MILKNCLTLFCLLFISDLAFSDPPDPTLISEVTPSAATSPVVAQPSDPTSPVVAQPLDPPSTLEMEYQNEKNLFLPRFSNYIALDRPSYILPFYYTGSPYYAVYQNQIPNNQSLQHTEFKAQLSVYLPLVKNLFYNKNLSINLSYTQLIYWQLYTSSPWFRESDYEPYLALRYRIVRNIFGQLSLNHESNAKGGALERSWNRLIGTFEYSTPDLFLQLNGWVLLFQGSTSEWNNPQIAYYLGYDKIILSYRLFKKLILSVEANNIESAYTRGFVLATASFPLTRRISLYGQYFYGYGQSLIEYNHKTQSFGMGFSLNDWQ